MEFEERRSITKTVTEKEPVSQWAFRDWFLRVRKGRKKLFTRLLEDPELILLFSEWCSLWLRKFALAGDPILLDRYIQDFKKQIGNKVKNQLESSKSLASMLFNEGVIITKYYEEELKSKISVGILTDTYGYVYSELLQLNMKDLTALTIYMLKLIAGVHSVTICRLLNDLRVDNKYDPYGSGPKTINTYWYRYQKSGARVQDLYTSLQSYLKT